MVSNKSAPRYLSLAPRRSRLRNSIKTSVHATPAVYRSSEMLGSKLLVSAVGEAKADQALGAGTKTELIPVTFPNRANYQSRAQPPAPQPHMQCSTVNKYSDLLSSATFLSKIATLCHQTFTLERSSDYQPEPTVCPASAMQMELEHKMHKIHSFSVSKQAGFQTNAVLSYHPPPH